MNVNFYLSGDPVHDRVIRALYDGCPEDKSLRTVTQYDASDVAVVFGVYKKAVPFSTHRGKVIAEQEKAGLKTIVLETGYIKRGDGEGDFYAAGFNGLNNRADFRNANSPPDRWEKLGVELKPWRSANNGVVLLCGQVPWDASVQDTHHSGWLHAIVEEMSYSTNRKIVFRPHPLAKVPNITGAEYSTAPLMEDLDRTHVLVTFNSNSSVESVVEGVPAITFDEGAMAFDVTAHDLSFLERPLTPDREQWAANLAYTQWTPAEMRRGETWQHLFR